ncbi:MAG: hypothetical protein H0X42_00350 [Solirubrobacterales bacterium]|nr:hypothetical protein [Solirubrobacterales bacterium]
MFGSDKLVDGGARVNGVIIEAPEFFRGSTDMRGRYKVTVRVQLDDGGTVEVERRLHLSCGEHRVGAVLPMRYDPTDSSKIEIDEPALTAGRDADFAAIKERAVARGDAQAGRRPVRTR